MCTAGLPLQLRVNRLALDAGRDASSVNSGPSSHLALSQARLPLHTAHNDMVGGALKETERREAVRGYGRAVKLCAPITIHYSRYTLSAACAIRFSQRPELRSQT